MNAHRRIVGHRVEWFDPITDEWGQRMFQSRNKAWVYADEMFDLLKAEGEENPVVSTIVVVATPEA